MSSKYFSDKEIACPCCGLIIDNRSFLSMLDKLREAVRHPLHVNSFVRCEKHNAEVGGSPNSSHLRGLAVDLQAPSGVDKGKIIQAWARIVDEENKHWIEAGFYPKVSFPFRVEVGAAYLHLDVDETKPNPCVWVNKASIARG